MKKLQLYALVFLAGFLFSCAHIEQPVATNPEPSMCPSTTYAEYCFDWKLYNYRSYHRHSSQTHWHLKKGSVFTLGNIGRDKAGEDYIKMYDSLRVQAKYDFEGAQYKHVENTHRRIVCPDSNSCLVSAIGVEHDDGSGGTERLGHCFRLQRVDSNKCDRKDNIPCAKVDVLLMDQLLGKDQAKKAPMLESCLSLLANFRSNKAADAKHHLGSGHAHGSGN